MLVSLVVLQSEQRIRQNTKSNATVCVKIHADQALHQTVPSGSRILLAQTGPNTGKTVSIQDTDNAM